MRQLMKRIFIANKMACRAVVLLVLMAVVMGAGVASAQTQPPQIFFTDLDSGPNAGGENVGGTAGAYVTIYGNFFGSPQGTSTVTWNGLNCLRVVPATGSYAGWGAPYFWYQRIIVQIGSGCTAGTGNFVVTVNGKASNGFPFAVRATGRSFFVATTGSDTNAGSAASPFKTITRCRNALAAGDTCYIGDGVKATAVDNYDSTLALSSGGTAGNPIAFVAYPGATATLGNSTITYGLRVPNISVSANFVTIAGLFFSPSDQAMDATNSNNWRVVGNNFQCPRANGQNGCFTTHEISIIKFYGNETTNVGPVAASKQQHAVYFSSDTNHVDMGWNFVHNNNSCRAVQFHSSPLGGGGASDPTGHNQFDLSVHDNLIHDDPCDGIEFATVDPSQGRVEAYNNVIYHVGIGPDPADGEGDYSCIRVAGITNTGPAGGGTVEIYNNTLRDCGPHPGTINKSGAFIVDGGNTALITNLRNNIVHQNAGEFWANGGKALPTTTGSTNLWWGSNQPLPTQTTSNINADPLFLDLALNNFHIQSTSPAKDVGITISSANTYKSFLPWNGDPEGSDGVSRPQGTSYDLGALEFFTGSDLRPAPPSNLIVTVH